MPVPKVLRTENSDLHTQGSLLLKIVDDISNKCYPARIIYPLSFGEPTLPHSCSSSSVNTSFPSNCHSAMCILRMLLLVYLKSFTVYSYKLQSTPTTPVHSNCTVSLTFLVGECITGAGGEGGPRGTFLLMLL